MQGEAVCIKLIERKEKTKRKKSKTEVFSNKPYCLNWKKNSLKESRTDITQPSIQREAVCIKLIKREEKSEAKNLELSCLVICLIQGRTQTLFEGTQNFLGH